MSMNSSEPNALLAGITYDDCSLDGLIKMRWEFGIPSRIGSVYTIPFVYSSLSLLPSEMKESRPILYINGDEYIGTVGVNVFASKLMSCYPKSNNFRSYLVEEGYMRFDLQRAIIPTATQYLQFVIRIRGMDVEIPPNIAIRLLKATRPLDLANQ